MGEQERKREICSRRLCKLQTLLKKKTSLKWKKEIFTYQTYWPEKEEKSGRATMKYPNVSSLLYYMGKNELFTKVSKSFNKVTSKHSQDIQLYSNIARDILVWVFLPSSLLFKTPRTPWFDNDLIARYFQFEYSKASLKDLFLRDIRYFSAYNNISFNRMLCYFTLWH